VDNWKDISILFLARQKPPILTGHFVFEVRLEIALRIAASTL
jgi:hypothetical protein